MPKGQVSLDFVITEEKDGLKRLTLDGDALRKIMTENVKVAENLQTTDAEIQRHIKTEQT